MYDELGIIPLGRHVRLSHDLGQILLIAQAGEDAVRVGETTHTVTVM